MTVKTSELATIHVEHTYTDNEEGYQLDVIRLLSDQYHRPSVRGSGRVWCQENFTNGDAVIVTKEMAVNLQLKECERGCWQMASENEVMHDYSVTIPSVRIELRYREDQYNEADELIESLMPQIEQATDKAMGAFDTLLKEINPNLSVKHHL